jgi:hypothetical protein
MGNIVEEFNRYRSQMNEKILSSRQFSAEKNFQP